MSTEILEDEIKNLVAQLHVEGKHFLAKKIEASWNMSIEDYSASLYEYRPKYEMEPALQEAFDEEFQELGIEEEKRKTLLDELKKYRTVQTSSHIEVAPPPRRFCIDWMSTRGLSEDRHYFVGAFSGVPFSNKSKPGRISYQNTSVNFMPNTHQDALVYTTEILEKTRESYASLPHEITSVIPEPVLGDSFSIWTCRGEARVLEKILEHKTCVFDINKVVTRYLIKVLPDTSHPIHKLLLTPSVTHSVLETFGSHLHFFYTPYETAKYSKQESLYYLDGYGFKGDHAEYPHSLPELLRGLQEKKLCPATLLVFTVLCFLNDFQCLGSFVQVEYASNFKELWKKIGLLHKEIDHVPTDTLTTCMFPADPEFQGLDVLVSQTPIPGNVDDLLGNYYLPIWKQDLYYTNKLT